MPARARVDRADVQAGGAADAAQRLAADLVGQHAACARRRAGSGGTRAGRRPRARPVHSDVYGFIRSAVEERGRSWSITSRSRHSASTFSMPMTVMSTRGQRRAHAPVALGLDHADRARLGHAEVRAADRHGHGEELRRAGAGARPRRWPAPRARAPGPGRSCARTARRSPPGSCGWRGRGCATACRRSSCTISSARSVSTARMPLLRQRLVEPDLVRGQRLDLDDLVAAVVARDARRRSRWPPPPSRAQCTVPPARVTLASSRSSCSGSVASARSLIAAPAARSASQSSTSATTAARLARISVVALPRLRRSWVSLAPRGRRRGSRTASFPISSGSPPEAGSDPRHSCAARTSAKCMTRTPARWRLAPRRCASGTTCPPPCTPRRGCRARGAACRESIAIDVSAFLIANVPPKPQHSSASPGPRGRSRARPAAAARGRSPTCSAAHGVAGRVQRHAVREGGADVLRAEHVDEELAQLVDRRARRTARPGAGTPRARSPAHEALGHTTASAPREHAPEPLGQRPRLVVVARVAVHLPAARLLGRELDLAAQPLQHRDRRAPRLGEQRVVEAGDEQRDPHGRGVCSRPAQRA